MNLIPRRMEQWIGNLAERYSRREAAKKPDLSGAIRDEYDMRAPDYDQWADAHSYNGQSRVYDALAPRINAISADVRHELRVLDLGTATGKLADHFKRAGFKTVGLDISPKMLKIASQRGRIHTAMQENLMEKNLRLPFGDMSTQFVVSFGLLEHFEDPQLLVDEIGRIIAPNGMVAMTHEIFEFGKGQDVKEFSGESDGIRLFAHSQGYIRECFKRAGIIGTSQGEFVAAQSPRVAQYKRTYDLFVGRPTQEWE